VIDGEALRLRHAGLGKAVTPYISVAALGVNQNDLPAALEMVTKRSAPESAGVALRKTSVSGFAKSSWFGELENVSVGMGVSLL
jgi:hypothetical protein